MEQHTCERCKTKFERPSKGYKKRFCSRSCANVREQTEKMNSKRRVAMAVHWDNIEKTFGHRKAAKPNTAKRMRTYQDNFMRSNFDDLKHGTKRRRVMIEQKNCCVGCGISEWRGSRITLEFDHVNGDRKDESRENVRFLCPNCHAQTDTWRGRNGTDNKKIKRIDSIPEGYYKGRKLN